MIGISVTRRPVAALTAFAMAAATGITGGSPTPRRPYGPDCDGISRITDSMGGIWCEPGRV